MGPDLVRSIFHHDGEANQSTGFRFSHEFQKSFLRLSFEPG